MGEVEDKWLAEREVEWPEPVDAYIGPDFTVPRPTDMPWSLAHRLIAAFEYRLGDTTMPVTVGKKRKKGYPIVEKATGKVKGYSKTKQNADSSARARNAALHGWKPTRKK